MSINKGTPIAEGKVVFLDFPKFDVYAETPENPGKRSKLSFKIRDGNPRLFVNTNVPSDQVNMNGTMYAPFYSDPFLGFLDTFEKAILNGNDTKYKIDCLVNNRANENEKIVMSQLYFGKDKEGICWLSIVAENRPRIVFQFKLNDYNRFTHGNGVPFTAAEASEMVALAYIRSLRAITIDMKGKYVKVYEQEAKNSKPQVAVKKTETPIIEEDILF